MFEKVTRGLALAIALIVGSVFVAQEASAQVVIRTARPGVNRTVIVGNPGVNRTVVVANPGWNRGWYGGRGWYSPGWNRGWYGPGPNRGWGGPRYRW